MFFSTGNVDMDQQKIKSLITMMDNSVLTELSYSEGDVRLTLVCDTQLSRAEQMPAFVDEAPSSVSVPCVNTSHSITPTAINVCSPMYGVVYLTPSDNEPPFVKPGDTVEAGDTLCLLEAMKMFHSVVAEKAGVVSEICINAGDEVVAGQPLFLID